MGGMEESAVKRGGVEVEERTEKPFYYFGF